MDFLKAESDLEIAIAELQRADCNLRAAYAVWERGNADWFALPEPTAHETERWRRQHDVWRAAVAKREAAWTAYAAACAIWYEAWRLENARVRQVVSL